EGVGDGEAAQRYLAETRRLEPASSARVNVQTLVRTVVPETHASAGALDAAIANAEAELAATPAGAVARITVARRKLGELYRDAGQLAAAYEQLGAVLAEEPANAEGLRGLVEVAHAAGRWLAAAQLAEGLPHRGVGRRRWGRRRSTWWGGASRWSAWAIRWRWWRGRASGRRWCGSGCRSARRGSRRRRRWRRGWGGKWRRGWGGRWWWWWRSRCR